MLNNIDPERDVQILEYSYGPVFAVDGTPKLKEEGFSREWPEKITMSEAVKRRVDERWSRLIAEASPAV